MKKTPSLTKAQLRHKVKETEAMLASTYHFAGAHLPKTSTKHLMASGVLLQLTFLGGKEAITPVVILNGLSDETINALLADLKRSYEWATEFKPIEPKGN